VNEPPTREGDECANASSYIGAAYVSAPDIDALLNANALRGGRIVPRPTTPPLWLLAKIGESMPELPNIPSPGVRSGEEMPEIGMEPIVYAARGDVLPGTDERRRAVRRGDGFADRESAGPSAGERAGDSYTSMRSCRYSLSRRSGMLSGVASASEVSSAADAASTLATLMFNSS
jgi:hypothetical protein